METFLSVDRDIVIKNEIQEKKSRFLTFCKYVETSEEAESFYRKLKMEYKDARHVVFAYRLITTSRCTDDGEPSGTAGKPILDILEKENVYNIIVCVVRYFGGVKLGAGPLLRVYASSAKGVLGDLRVYEKCYKSELIMTFQEFERLLKMIPKEKIKTFDVRFSDGVTLKAIYPVNFKLGFGKVEKQEETFCSFKVGNGKDNKNR